jgi:nicotinate-nucleotide adenylyltransferase
MSLIMNKGLVVFGGSFDPPHLGHLIIGRWAFEDLGLPVHFIPVGSPVHKDGVSPPGHRLEMLKIALQGQVGFVLDYTEIFSQQPNYSIDTLKRIALKHDLNPWELFFMVGGDSVLALDSWYKPQEIGRLATLVIVSRDGQQEEALLDSCRRAGILRAHLARPPRIDISSSLVRNRVRQSKPIDLLVPPGVWQYIIKHKLYCRLT